MASLIIEIEERLLWSRRFTCTSFTRACRPKSFCRSGCQDEGVYIRRAMSFSYLEEGNIRTKLLDYKELAQGYNPVVEG